jgi:hypothetical protein
METKRVFVSIWFCCIVAILTRCTASTPPSSTPTRVASHITAEVPSTNSIIEADQIDFLNIYNSTLFVHLTDNKNKQDVATDTFHHRVGSVKDGVFKEITSHSSKINTWNAPLWSDDTGTWWKTIQSMKDQNEIIWMETDGHRQDRFTILPGFFTANLQKKCMCFLEQEEEFTIIDAEKPGNLLHHKVKNPFPSISFHPSKPNAYTFSQFYKFSSGYLLIVSNYSDQPYRYLFFPLVDGEISNPQEIIIPSKFNAQWFLADVNDKANVFVLLDYTSLIAYENTLQYPDAPALDETEANTAKLMVVDLFNPNSPLYVECNVFLASAVRILFHPDGAQICVIPRNLKNHPLQTPIWNRESNSIKTQNPVYIPIDGKVFSDPALRFLRNDPLEWQLFVSGKDTTQSGWIVSCVATEDSLQFIEYKLEYDEDFMIPSIASIGNRLYFTVISKQAYFSPMNRGNTTSVQLDTILKEQ